MLCHAKLSTQYQFMTALKGHDSCGSMVQVMDINLCAGDHVNHSGNIPPPPPTIVLFLLLSLLSSKSLTDRSCMSFTLQVWPGWFYSQFGSSIKWCLLKILSNGGEDRCFFFCCCCWWWWWWCGFSFCDLLLTADVYGLCHFIIVSCCGPLIKWSNTLLVCVCIQCRRTQTY